MKYIVVVPDGMADQPLEELGNKTPLEVARTTNMDYMAQHGAVGLVRTIPKKMSPGSDIGNMALMGYDPKACHTGRAPLEAANLDIHLADDEVAFRCNLVTIIDQKMHDYSAGHIRTKEASILINALNEKMDLSGVKFYTGKSYRHLVVLKARNPKTYCEIKTVPPHDILGKTITTYLPQGPESQMPLKLMEKSKTILGEHSVNQVRVDLGENPANMIWLWGQGTSPHLPPFKEKFGATGAIISAVDLVNGIGRLAGLDVINVPGITGYYDTDYKAKAEYALEALKSHDFVYIHIEAPDEAGHNGDIEEKVKAIERIDKDILGPILNHYGKGNDVRILVLPDHPTPLNLRTHTDDPVGYVMYGKGVEHNGCSIFNEHTAKDKGLIFKSGEELITHFMTKHL